jgi:D-lactate dehydrogenase (cytochrome)
MPLDPQLASRLADLLGSRFSQAPSDRDLHGRDESPYSAPPPDAVAWPLSTAEVSAIMALCHEHRTPVVPFGTGSSLEGHVLAVAGGLSLDLSRMDAILAVSDEDLDCRVQAGVRREALDRALGERGLLFGVDPGADATLGGMAATGASGTMTVRYGNMRAQVLGLEAVLADGTVIHTGSRARKSSAGYDLTGLLVGSEGTLAVITELELRVHGVPERIAAARCSFPTIGEVVAAVIDIVRIGVPVARCDLIDSLAMHAVNEHSGLSEPELPTLFLEFHGAPGAVDEEIETVRHITTEHGGGEFAWAATTQERAAMWRARHQAYFAGRLLRPGTLSYATDICVPISALAEMIALAEELTGELPFPGPMVGHVADGNFHTQLLVRDDPDERRLAKEFVDALVERAHVLGGTCTGEHGIGIGKRAALVAEVGEEGVAVMRAVKHALDPLNLLNPGKVLFDAPAPAPAPMSQR